MLTRFSTQWFKSLDVDVRLPSLTVLFGPNSVGKSNFLDALQALSRIATSRTLKEALASPIRGYPIEVFRFPPGGLTELLGADKSSLALEADLQPPSYYPVRYRVDVQIHPATGSLSVGDEYLAVLTRKGEPRGVPTIQASDGVLRIRRKSKPAHPREESRGLNHTLLSDPRFGGVEYRPIEKTREEMLAWHTYYLDPRVSMRLERPPSDVTDIGPLGEDIAPFLYRLRNERPKHFDAVRRTLRAIIPSVQDLSVDLDKKRGSLDIQVRQEGIDYSSRVISEGTLRVLALCAICLNPWPASLVAFEEPENGVHPRRVERIADLLVSLAAGGPPDKPAAQVVVTSHSPLFCAAILRKKKELGDRIALYAVTRELGVTRIHPFVPPELWEEKELAKALADRGEEGVFEGLVLRGMLDE
ncbi:MAG: ATP-binding protein [Planctomycetes bacterium]|nr:ATP-binding protein [Planctomycetota bacterium]